jgi:hypothetical protein
MNFFATLRQAMPRLFLFWILPFCCHAYEMSDTVILSVAQKQRMYDAVEQAEFVSTDSWVNRTNPHLRIYVAAFDGTWNDRENLERDRNCRPTESPTLVAEFERNLPNTAVLKSDYFEGVGTRTNYFMSEIQGAAGWGSLERAERAYRKFNEQIEKWRKEDPDIKVHVHVMSFSRGGGSAIHFLNMVDKQGALPVAGGEFYGKPIPGDLGPHKISSTATLLDTVVTGQRGTLMLGLPVSTLSVLQVTAGLEMRRAFAYTDILDPARIGEINQVISNDLSIKSRWNYLDDKNTGVITVLSYRSSARSSEGTSTYYARVRTVELPGVHSDIGGAYLDGGIRDVSKYIVDSWHKNLGFLVTPDRPSYDHIERAFAHDSRWAVDKFVDFLVGDNTRGHFDGKISDWDGSLAYEVSYGTKKVRQPWLHGRLEKGAEFPEEGFNQHDTVISLNQAGDPIFSKDGSTAYRYDADADRITLYGQALNFLEGRAHIAKLVSENGGPLPLSVKPFKYLNAYKLAGVGTATVAPAVQPHSAEDSRTPEEMLHDLLTNGLRSMGKNSQILEPAELANVVDALCHAEKGDKLLVTNGRGVIGRDWKPQKDAALFEASYLRKAVGCHIGF